MTTQTIGPGFEPRGDTADTADTGDPFQLDITFIENTPASETVLMCGTGDNCGSSCPSACVTS
jgi:FxLD family lantipeptide